MALFHLTGSFWVGSGHSIDRNGARGNDPNRPEAVSQLTREPASRPIEDREKVTFAEKENLRMGLPGTARTQSTFLTLVTLLV